MKFEFTLQLAAPRERVWSAFDNPSNLPRWQASLVSFERISGTPGAVGAVSRLVYREGGREIEMLETVGVHTEPEEFSATYDSEHAETVLWNRFAVLDPDHTRWHIRSEVRLKGMARFMGPMLRGMIEQRVRTDCERFQRLLEAGELEC